MDFIICLTMIDVRKKARILLGGIQADKYEIILNYLEKAAPQVKAMMIKR